jgi:uracil phosphoribosyltransferase
MKKLCAIIGTKVLFSMVMVSFLYADDAALLSRAFPIVKSSLKPSAYKRILMTRLRDKYSSRALFCTTANALTEILVHEVVDCSATTSIDIETPVASCKGELLDGSIEFVSIMRSGDALLHIFRQHFPDAAINKILIQRDEETAEPVFKYMKLSPTIARAQTIVITEPMIATGGTLSMVIELLKSQGIEEKNIIVASICAAPEGLTRLAQLFPELRVVVIVIDDFLNEKKYISPGIGDFGDRYFGT